MSNPVTIKINGTGTLELENYCEANTVDDGIKLTPNIKVISKVFLNYGPKLNISINFKVWRNIIDKDIKNLNIQKPKTIIKDNLNKLIEVYLNH